MALEGTKPEKLSYVVVDEILGNAVGLALSEWPELDQEGRPRFRGTPLTLGADRDTLQRFLSKHRRPRALADRPLRIGDVFALRTIPATLEEVQEELAAQRPLEPHLNPESWIRPPVYDVTADAREIAKTAFYAAVAPRLSNGEAAQLAELVEQRASLPAPFPARDWIRSNLKWIAATTILFVGGLVAGSAVGGAFDGSGSTITVPITQTLTTITTRLQEKTETVTQATTARETERQTTTETDIATVTATVTETETATVIVTTTETVPTTVTVVTTAPPQTFQ